MKFILREIEPFLLDEWSLTCETRHYYTMLLECYDHETTPPSSSMEDLLLDLGKLCEFSRDNQVAILYLQRFVSLSNNRARLAQAYFHLGNCLESTGFQFEDVQHTYETGLKLAQATQQSNVILQLVENLEYVSLRFGNVDCAARYSEQLVKLKALEDVSICHCYNFELKSRTRKKKTLSQNYQDGPRKIMKKSLKLRNQVLKCSLTLKRILSKIPRHFQLSTRNWYRLMCRLSQMLSRFRSPYHSGHQQLSPS